MTEPSSDGQVAPVTSTQGVDRDTWLAEVCGSFVHPSMANRQYYQLILEVLWPQGSSIPGPVIPMKAIRDAINSYRRNLNPEATDYQDPARRIRELQGEEGVVGIVKYGNGSGTKYQLAHLNLEPKRDPRTGLPEEVWNRILAKYGYRCASCGRHQSEIRLDQDHKIPRLRGGGDNEENWQPLCKECNNFKSVACRGCDLECLECPWAFPERNAQIKINQHNINRLHLAASARGISPSEILNIILDNFFEQAD